MFVKKTALWLVAGGLIAGTLVAQGPIPNIPADKDIVAEVNGKPITRKQLADELIARKGRAQLEALVHRTLVEQTCQAKGITVTEKEVQDELIAEMKAAASANLDDFEKGMLRPRKTSLYEYREDVIRPRLMIQKLAFAQLTVSEEDLKREFVCRYGPKAAVRMITIKDAQMAKRIWTEIGNNPEMFIRYAKIQENGDLAAVAGMMTPFGRHTTHDIIEQRAFELKNNEISEVLQTPEKGYVILMKVQELPARADVTLEQKIDEIRISALEKKRQVEVPKIIAELKKQASTKIKLFLGTENDPQKSIEKYGSQLEGVSK